MIWNARDSDHRQSCVLELLLINVFLRRTMKVIIYDEANITRQE